MLEVDEVSKRLGSREVLVRANLRCAGGEVTTVEGVNGSGKSTLLKILVGLIEPDRGAVRLLGEKVTGMSGRARRALGYVPDATDVLPDLSVMELIALAQTLRRVSAALEPLRERLGLAAVWRQRMRTLSFGQRKRACLMAALLGDPWLLVLDEPTNGLDADGCALIRTLAEERRAQGLATVVATNDLPFAASLPATRHRIGGGQLVPVAPPG
jgi:ABC-type multidrug transport system ATPase subunit